MSVLGAGGEGRTARDGIKCYCGAKAARCARIYARRLASVCVWPSGELSNVFIDFWDDVGTMLG